jgi:hypothetical protein
VESAVRFERTSTCLSCFDSEIVAGQVGLHHPQDRGLIVDHQDTCATCWAHAVVAPSERSHSAPNAESTSGHWGSADARTRANMAPLNHLVADGTQVRRTSR